MDSSISVTSTTQTSSTSTSTKSTSNITLGEDDFMLLLLAQLKNQDPLEPMSNQEFMSQLTQLNSLTVLKGIEEAINNQTTNQQLSYAATLIGKEVSWTSEDDGSTVSGVVSGVVIEGGVAMLQIGDEKIPLSDIVAVKESSSDSQSTLSLSA